MLLYIISLFLFTSFRSSSSNAYDENEFAKYADERCEIPTPGLVQKYNLYDKTNRKITYTPGVTYSNVIIHCVPGLLTKNETQFYESFCRNKTWTPELDGCDIPDCGLSQDSIMLPSGEIALISEVPWHVAIYKTSAKYTLICGGTLISPMVAISAAHCFYDEIENVASNRTTDYLIAVGKRRRDFHKVDNMYQKTYKVKDLIFSTNGYDPTSGHRGSDIIMIVLAESVTFNRFVYPACIDWTHPRGFDPKTNVTGKVAGWGADESGRISQNLKIAELFYVRYEECIKKLNSVTTDKFCAGGDDGDGVRKGDGGGGLLFKNEDNGLYYLRGVVSTRALYKNLSTSTFTDVSLYVNWINEQRKIINDLY